MPIVSDADVQLPDDLKRCVEFHGHLCPGVVIGWCAARLGMDELSAGRSGDEELIAVVENDTCAVDAVQVLTGCTFGKGNLMFRDYGKMAFTFATRGDGRSIRLRAIPSGPDLPDELPEGERRRRLIEYMLAADPAELFDVRRNVLPSLPQPARIHESVVCDECGESVMSTRIREIEGRSLCIPCAAAVGDDAAPDDPRETDTNE